MFFQFSVNRNMLPCTLPLRSRFQIFKILGTFPLSYDDSKLKLSRVWLIFSITNCVLNAVARFNFLFEDFFMERLSKLSFSFHRIFLIAIPPSLTYSLATNRKLLKSTFDRLTFFQRKCKYSESPKFLYVVACPAVVNFIADNINVYYFESASLFSVKSIYYSILHYNCIYIVVACCQFASLVFYVGEAFKSLKIGVKKPGPKLTLGEIKNTIRLYRQLSDLCGDIVGIYGMFVVIMIASSFLGMLVNITLWLAHGLEEFTFGILVWFSHYVLPLLLVLYSCQRVKDDVSIRKSLSIIYSRYIFVYILVLIRYVYNIYIQSIIMLYTYTCTCILFCNTGKKSVLFR